MSLSPPGSSRPRHQSHAACALRSLASCARRDRFKMRPCWTHVSRSLPSVSGEFSVGGRMTAAQPSLGTGAVPARRSRRPPCAASADMCLRLSVRAGSDSAGGSLCSFLRHFRTDARSSCAVLYPHRRVGGPGPPCPRPCFLRPVRLVPALGWDAAQVTSLDGRCAEQLRAVLDFLGEWGGLTVRGQACGRKGPPPPGDMWTLNTEA